MNVVMFLCAMSAGTYPVWIGRREAADEAGRVLMANGRG
jgi:hypothetical protein